MGLRLPTTLYGILGVSRFAEFDINRDNATTTGYALICISGYIVG